MRSCSFRASPTFSTPTFCNLSFCYQTICNPRHFATRLLATQTFHNPSFGHPNISPPRHFATLNFCHTRIFATSKGGGPFFFFYCLQSSQFEWAPSAGCGFASLRSPPCGARMARDYRNLHIGLRSVLRSHKRPSSESRGVAESWGLWNVWVANCLSGKSVWVAKCLGG